MNKDVLTTQEAAEYLQIGRTKMYELMRSKDFPVLQLGRAKRVPVQELKNWISKKSHKQTKGEIL